MIYYGYPLDIHGWKTKPDTKPKTEPENREWEIILKSEPTDIRPEPDLLPSLRCTVFAQPVYIECPWTSVVLFRVFLDRREFTIEI
jgi:hypothetical protein